MAHWANYHDAAKKVDTFMSQWSDSMNSVESETGVRTDGTTPVNVPEFKDMLETISNQWVDHLNSGNVLTDQNGNAKRHILQIYPEGSMGSDRDVLLDSIISHLIQMAHSNLCINRKLS
jgi:hypothetical protein